MTGTHKEKGKKVSEKIITNKNIRLETKNLIIRPLRLSDAEAITKHLQNKKIHRNLTNLPWPYTLDSAKYYIKKSNKPSASNIAFGIYSKEHKEIIGVSTLSNINLKHKQAEGGSWLAEKYWGTGYIYEAKLEIYKYIFNVLKFNKIFSKTFTFNIRSEKHLLKLGFRKCGILEQDLYKNNKYLDTYFYELLKRNFKYSQLKKTLLK